MQAVYVYMCTWIMEKVADHSRTYHCLKGSVAALIFCSPCLTLLRAGKLVAVTEHVNTH